MALADTLPARPIWLGRNIPVIAETALIVFLLILYTNALLGPLLTDPTDPEGPVILRLMWLPIYAVTLIFAAWRLQDVVAIVWRMPFIVMLMVLIALSVFWSIDTGLTMRRTIAIGMTTLFGIYLAARYDWQNLLAILAIAWLILGVGSFLVSVAVPSFGQETYIEHYGAWKGLWFTKNAMGGHMARASFLFAFLAITQPQWRKAWIMGALITVVLVIFSTSKTSLLGMLIGFAVLFAASVMRRGPVKALALVWFMVTFVTCLTAFVVFQPDLAFALIGRDASLTGRTDIWEALAIVIQERLWLGHGYGAFWGTGSLPAEFVREYTEWDVPTAHNGWLETWLSLGLVGVVVFLVSFVGTIARAISAALSGWFGFFVLGFVLQFFLFSISESEILQQNSISWVSYVAVAAALVQQSRLKRGKASPARRQRDFILVNQ